MPEQKLPLAGEWWGNEDSCRRCFIIGLDADGELVYNTSRSGIYNSVSLDRFVKLFNHYPDCTGWDWKPEPKPPKRVPVRLWYDRTAMRVLAALNEDFIPTKGYEILHDENGFYTMEEN